MSGTQDLRLLGEFCPPVLMGDLHRLASVIVLSSGSSECILNPGSSLTPGLNTMSLSPVLRTVLR